MKKLLFMLAAVAMVASVQAASVNWKCTNVYAGNDTDKVTGVAYFLTTDMTSPSFIVRPKIVISLSWSTRI